MDEEKEIEGDKKEEPVSDADKGDKPKGLSKIEEANLAAERMEIANKKREELIAKQEEVYAQQKLGGTAEGGQAPEKPKEETPQEYKDKVMANDL